MTAAAYPGPTLPYGHDWPDLDLWCDRDGRVHHGTGPYLNRPWRWLRRRLRRSTAHLSARDTGVPARG